MHLYCLSCQAAFPPAPRCPRCGDRLITPSEAQAVTAGPTMRLPALPRPPAVSRMAVGAVTALGLYLGLRELAAGIDPSAGVGLPLTIGFWLVGVVAGGLLAGAGRPAGMATGAAVGAGCAVVFILAAVVGGTTPELVHAGVGVGLVAAAAGAGAVGARMWPAPVDLPDPVIPASRVSSLVQLARKDKADRGAKPTVWLRVVLGAAVVVAAVAGADAARTGLRDLSSRLHLGGPAMAAMVDVQFATLGLVLGGVLAGGGTGAGTRHGLFAGLLAGLTTAGMLMAGTATLVPVAEGLHGLFGVSAASPTGAQSAALLFVAVLAGTTVAGWLGGQLLPPLAPRWMRSRLIPMG